MSTDPALVWFYASLSIVILVIFGHSLRIFFHWCCQRKTKPLRIINLCKCELWCWDGRTTRRYVPWTQLHRKHEKTGVYFEPHLPSGIQVVIIDDTETKYETVSDDRAVGELFVVRTNAQRFATANIVFVHVIDAETHTPLAQYIWQRTSRLQKADPKALLTLQQRMGMTFKSP